MRVLQILHTHERGGIETLSGMIGRGLAEHGFRVDTVYLFPQAGLGVIGRLRHAAMTAWRLLRDDHDAVISYQATASILNGVCGWLRGCRHRIVHQTALPSETAWPVRLADRIAGTLGLYTANIANTAFTRDEFRNYPASYRRSLILIVHGLAYHTATRNRAATRTSRAWSPDSRLILNVGRMTAQKNQAVLIDALVEVSDARLIVAGQGPDEKCLLARAAAGISDRVELLGAMELDEIANLTAACDVFAFPSNWETFGLAAAEAAMTGIAMVVSDLPVLREVLASPASPVTFIATDDVAGWTAALRRALDTPPPDAARSSFAREIQTRYAVERMVERYVELLNADTSKSVCA